MSEQIVSRIAGAKKRSATGPVFVLPPPGVGVSKRMPVLS